MRITRKQLETKVNNYNSISDIKLKNLMMMYSVLSIFIQKITTE